MDMPYSIDWETCLIWWTDRHAWYDGLTDMPDLMDWETCLIWWTDRHAWLYGLMDMPELMNLQTCLIWYRPCYFAQSCTSMRLFFTFYKDFGIDEIAYTCVHAIRVRQKERQPRSFFKFLLWALRCKTFFSFLICDFFSYYELCQNNFLCIFPFFESAATYIDVMYDSVGGPWCLFPDIFANDYGRTDLRTDGRTDGRTDPLIEMRVRI